LAPRRALLSERELVVGARKDFDLILSRNPTTLPSGLPAPEDDGAAAHLLGRRLPAIALASTMGRPMRVDIAPEPSERLVLYAYPRTGRPGQDPLTPDWDLIPGARGCTPESCSFRDHAAELHAAGAAVAGLSTQDTEYQREAATRLQLPFALLSDAALTLTRAVELPTFTVAGQVLLKRLTLIVRDGVIEHVFYPVFPPDTHASLVLEWLRGTIMPMPDELLEAVRAAAQAPLPRDERARRIADFIRTTTGRRWVGVYEVTANEVVNLAWSGPAPPAHLRFPAERGLTGAAISARETVISNDVARDSRYLTTLASTGSEMIAPVTVGDRVVGTLDVEDDSADAFSDNDRRLFSRIAGEMGPLYD
jgi:peroxiredoxin/putative methionine-R-sulfoxide reductase with GAF domain